MEVPPRLINGNGCPVTGIRLVATDILINVCKTIISDNPITKIAGKTAAQFITIRPALKSKIRYRIITRTPPIRPISSTIIEYIKSE